MKIHKISHAIFEITCRFFFKLHHSSVSWELFCTFVAETFYYFDNRSLSSVKLQIFDFTKSVHWQAPFVDSIWNFSIKSTDELYFMTLKNDAKFNKRPVCFKSDKNFVNFDRNTQKSQKFALWLVPLVQSM